MDLLKFLPKKRDRKWILAITPLTAVVAATLAIIARLMISLSPGAADWAVFLILSFLASLAICGFGYFGLMAAWTFSVAGLVAGEIFMAYVFTRPIQWVGIVGLVSGAQLAVIFFLMGSCVQMLIYLSRRRRARM